MVAWCLDNVHPEQSPAILEIGSGNGLLLTHLVQEGYNPQLLLGIDYSSHAVELAQKVANEHGESTSQITYNVCDFIQQDVPKLDVHRPTYDLVLDKGTYDAIALAGNYPDGTSPCELYAKRLTAILSPGGHFLITSCNFTEDELVTRFAKAELDLETHSTVKHQTYTYAGRSGSIVSTVAFRKLRVDENRDLRS